MSTSKIGTEKQFYIAAANVSYENTIVYESTTSPFFYLNLNLDFYLVDQIIKENKGQGFPTFLFPTVNSNDNVQYLILLLLGYVLSCLL